LRSDESVLTGDPAVAKATEATAAQGERIWPEDDNQLGWALRIRACQGLPDAGLIAVNTVASQSVIGC